MQDSDLSKGDASTGRPLSHFWGAIGDNLLILHLSTWWQRVHDFAGWSGVEYPCIELTMLRKLVMDLIRRCTVRKGECNMAAVAQPTEKLWSR